MSRFLTAASLALAVACLGVVAWFARENAALRRELANLRAAPAAAAPDAPTVSGAAGEAARAGAPVASTGAVAPAAAAPPSASDNGRGGRRGGDPRERAGEMFARALADPAARAAMLTRAKGEIDRRFGDYFVKLGLDEVQIETLRTLLAERQLARMESGLMERTAEDDAGRAEATAWREAKLASTEAEINALLGPDGLKSLQAYADSAPQRQVVDDIARRANYLGAPLASETSDRLLAAVQQADVDVPLAELPGRGRWNADGFGGRRQPVTAESVDTYLRDLRARNQRVIDQAKSFLTPTQLEALADQQIDEMQQAEAQLKFMLNNPELRGGFGPRGGGRGPGG